MFVNAHNLPAGHDLYTLAIADDGGPEVGYDEVDVIARRGASNADLLAAMTRDERDDYVGQRLIGVVNQSQAYVVWEDPNSQIRIER